MFWAHCTTGLMQVYAEVTYHQLIDRSMLPARQITGGGVRGTEDAPAQLISIQTYT